MKASWETHTGNNISKPKNVEPVHTYVKLKGGQGGQSPPQPPSSGLVPSPLGEKKMSPPESKMRGGQGGDNSELSPPPPLKDFLRKFWNFQKISPPPLSSDPI